MIKVTCDGKPVSEETVELALQEYFAKHPEPPYQFQAMDVAKNEYGQIRIIMASNGKLVSYDPVGGFQSMGQSSFENAGYKKIGVISDFIK
jgi:hypothetical protein